MDKFKLEVTDENIFKALESIDKIFKELGSVKGAHMHLLNASPECKAITLASMCKIFNSGKFKQIDLGEATQHLEAELSSNKLRK